MGGARQRPKRSLAQSFCGSRAIFHLETHVACVRVPGSVRVGPVDEMAAFGLPTSAGGATDRVYGGPRAHTSQ